MAFEKTYSKRDDKVYSRIVETRTDITGKEFTVRDEEALYDHEKHLPQLDRRLIVIHEEIAELQVDEAQVVEQIRAVKAARDEK